MATTRQRGALGEAFACARLLEDGYRILERNWRSGKSEIDLIAQKGNAWLERGSSSTARQTLKGIAVILRQQN